MATQLNWNDFKYFLALARRGRLRLAAADLGVDQATAGRRISALEQALGSRLFEQTAKGYALTEPGTRLLPVAEQMESQTLTAQAQSRDKSALLSGAVRVGAPVAASSYLLSGAAAGLIREHPRLEIEIVAVPRIFNLSVREADFAVAVSRPDRGRVLSRKITDYPLRLYAHQDYLASRTPIETLADLRRMHGIGYISDLIFDKELDYVPSVDPKLHPRLTSSNLIVQIQCTLAGGGICILPEFVARHYPCLQPVLESKVVLIRSYWLVIHQDMAKAERVRLVAERFAEAIKAGVAGAA
jgi:DNA-binding transcriptional LysR family regulator